MGLLLYFEGNRGTEKIKQASPREKHDIPYWPYGVSRGTTGKKWMIPNELRANRRIPPTNLCSGINFSSSSGTSGGINAPSEQIYEKVYQSELSCFKKSQVRLTFVGKDRGNESQQYYNANQKVKHYDIA